MKRIELIGVCLIATVTLFGLEYWVEGSGGLTDLWSDRLTVLSLCLTATGFSVALVQLSRISTVTQAEHAAIRRVTSSELLFLGPQFAIVAAHFDGAVGDNDHSAAQKLLAIWSDLASHVSGRLSVREDADAELVSRISSSSLLARDAHEALNDRSIHVMSSTREIRKEMAGVQSEIGTLMGKMVSRAGG